jgi:sensor c-di-GMP phosphodiesterase-like protein
MNKSTAIALTLLLATLAIGAPIWFAIEQSKKQGYDAETDRVLAYAKDVLHRSDVTADQVAEGIAKLKKAGDPDPCSEKNLAIMRQIDLASSYIQAFGHVAGDKLVCSSLGRHGVGLSLGPVDLITSKGTSIRNQVKLPFTGDNTFIVLEQLGFGAVIHKDLPIDTSTSDKDVALAIFSLEKRARLSAKGVINPDWPTMLKSGSEISFSDGRYVVAVVKSTRYLTVAVAAAPIIHLEARTQEVAQRLVPIGILAGIALTLAILYLARLQLALPTAIKAGLKRNEFFLLYQPIVNLQTGQWVGVEALLRWRRPVGEIVSPDIFIPIAEETDLIERITERVIALAAKDIGDVFRRYPDFHVAINLSAADLHSKHTPALLSRFLSDTGAGPKNVIVEATERGFLQVKLAKEVTGALRANGIRVAIDDFGTGYSSLSYLQTFEIDFLKIDRSFVETIGTDAPTSHVVMHIIGMAKDLNLDMVAEGVETEAQARFLREHGIQYAQGWLFGKPMPFPEILTRLSFADKADDD